MDKKEAVEAIKKYVRAANYITTIQIYLQDNFLLKHNLNFEHIKPRLLGHWGTCPGINFVYGNLNYLIKKHNARILFVLGVGHGFPALQANLFLENSLSKYYKKAYKNLNGLAYIAKNFCWPYGFPSHSNPGAPGVILEGGELGYSLSTSYGAALDNPDLIVACLIGDGEAETGPLSASWHLNKFLDPTKNGVVLPILHLNGYKISGPTIFGRMSNKELSSLFYGYGYDPIIVEGDNIYENMINSLEYCYSSILKLKKSKVVAPRLPMIILKTPKGWTGIKELNGNKIEGNCLSHQVVAKNAKSDLTELKALEDWLISYNFNELFNGKFSKDIELVIPKLKYCMGMNEFVCKKLNLPSIRKIRKFYEEFNKPGESSSVSMIRIGKYLSEIFKLNNNFRLMSPDETYSNKLDDVFKNTKRCFVWPLEKWDKDFSSYGKVIEVLSEHCLQGITQGYILTGRHAVFSSYEAFVEIVSSMADQYEKFLKTSREVPWRKDVASFNYILTSSGWRQEHNGFSHQNPNFISGRLNKNGISKVYFPPDANSALVVLEECLKSRNRINVIVCGKTLEPLWLNLGEAEKEFKSGLMTWDFASDKNPDLVFVGIGDYLTKECLAAISYLKKYLPELRLRFVNVIEVSALGIGENKHLENYFTNDKPVIFNYEGYPHDIEALLFKFGNVSRFNVHGYIEKGSTTTPFDMHVRNKTDRFNLAIDALNILAKFSAVNIAKASNLIRIFKDKLKYHNEYIIKNGVDLPEVQDWKWERKF
ncbi:phosphoketolase family protein [Candidatus Woesearchaeota archaeon]|nr:phosphoketolase family protein [Candidatus Woesearchaeota archaeon]